MANARTGSVATASALLPLVTVMSPRETASATSPVLLTQRETSFILKDFRKTAGEMKA